MAHISVVIPSYNHAAFIGKAVESVLEQTFTDLELLVIDDGSRDNSLQVLNAFHDPRLRVIAQENQGAHAAINRGLRESSGLYLAVLNSDDYFRPDRLEKAAAVFRASPDVGLVCSYIQVIDADGKLQGIKHGHQDLEPWPLEYPERSFRAGNDLRASLLTENFCATTSNFVFSRDMFERVGPFRPLRYTHDWDFALRVTRSAPIVLLPEPLVHYRIHANNTIRENQAAMIFEICWILAVHLPKAIRAGPLTVKPMEEWIEPLLHSIYTFQFDRVLVMLLALELSENEEQAVDLLDPDNALRARFLAYIQDGLRRLDQPALSPGLLKRARRVLSRLKRAIQR